MKKLKNILMITHYYNKLLENEMDEKRGRLYLYIYLTGNIVCYICWNVFSSLFGNLNYRIIIRILVLTVPFVNILFDLIHMPYWLSEGYKEKELYSLPIEPKMLFYIKFYKDILFKCASLSTVIVPLLLMQITVYEVVKILLLSIAIIIFIDATCANVFMLSIRFLNLFLFRVLMIGVPILLILYKSFILEPVSILAENYYVLYLIDLLLLMLLNATTIAFYKFCVLKSYDKQLFSKFCVTYYFSKVPNLMLEITDIVRNFSYYAVLICRSLLIEIVLYYNINRIELFEKQDGFLLITFIIMINAFNYYPVTCVSKDKNFKQLLCLPISIKRVIDVKVFISFIISIVLIICFYCFSYMSVRWNYDLIIFSIVYTYLLSYVGVQLDFQKPNFSYDNIDQLIRGNRNRINLIFISACFYFVLMIMSKFVSLYVISVCIVLLILSIRKRGLKL